jgi:thioesterase domain-containing protein
MSPKDLEQYLHDHIPLSAAMQVHVLDLSADEVVLGAPLAPNINHRHTVFGGSASALAILAAWSLLHTRLAAEDLTTRLVIQRNTVTYDKPLNGAFRARAVAPASGLWEAFTRTLRRKGRARISVRATLLEGDVEAGQLEGDFVALGMTLTANRA